MLLGYKIIDMQLFEFTADSDRPVNPRYIESAFSILPETEGGNWTRKRPARRGRDPDIPDWAGSRRVGFAFTVPRRMASVAIIQLHETKEGIPWQKRTANPQQPMQESP